MERQPSLIHEGYLNVCRYLGITPIVVSPRKNGEKQDTVGNNVAKPNILSFHLERDNDLEADFFGRKAKMARGPAVTSLRYKRPMLPIAIVHENGKYAIRIGTFLAPENYKKNEGGFVRMTEDALKQIEQFFIEKPGSFYCFSPIWLDQLPPPNYPFPFKPNFTARR